MEGKNKNDLKYHIAFSQITKIGPIKAKKLQNFFPTLADAWQANLADLVSAGIEEALAHEIIIKRSAINPDQELEKLEKEKIKTLILADEAYPPLLKEIFNPPFILYYKGELKALSQTCLAVVGTRRFSDYGRQVTIKIVSELAEQKITIVSGLALGIDGIAHQATLEASGLTVAVLGSGLDQDSLYPSSHRQLAEKIIASGGCVISEYPCGTPGFKQNFPMRNRIISGLSVGTLVIEAKESSGSLITAGLALEQNRDVFAVPGNIFSANSTGTNHLIKQGAKVVTEATDILNELSLAPLEKIITPEEKPELNLQETEVIKILSAEPLHIDKIVQLSKLNINTLSGLLMMLEIKGAIKDLGGKNYIVNF